MEAKTMIVQCQRCGARNRIPTNRLYEQPHCGKCHQLLSPKTGARPIDVTDRSFASEVVQQKGLVLVDFWAPWCAPCRMVAPVIEELAQSYDGRVKFAKLNVDENPLTANQYSVSSIPAMLLFKDGRLIDTLIGAMPKTEIERHLQARM